MGEIQKQALKMMAEQNIGAVITRFGWTWPHHVEESEEKAQAVISRLSQIRKGA